MIHKEGEGEKDFYWKKIKSGKSISKPPVNLCESHT